jgi:hypothetical protein
VTTLDGWLDRRRPVPPVELARALSSGEGACPPNAAPGSVAIMDALTARARTRLDRARGRVGRVRESAFELLAADALFTYACEAALEEPDAEAALARIARVAADP